jgi:beta-lactamase regulating signal transducer with metallopeptidase domain
VTAWTKSVGPALIEAVGWCLVHSVWQVAALALVAAILLRAMDRSKAQSRYFVACASLVTMVLFPVSTCGLFARSRNASEIPVAAVDQTASETIDGGMRKARSTLLENRAKQTPTIEGAGDHSTAAASLLAPSRLEKSFPWLVGAWGVGVLVFALRLLGGWVWIHWLVRHETKPVSESWTESLGRLKKRLKLARAVRLLESARVQVPLAIGWLRPVILLPLTTLTGLPADQLEAILAHELAHIRRYDYLVNLAQSVVETFLFYHPAVWWISRRIRLERENCCDDWAVELCGDRLVYTRALASLEERRGSGWLFAPSARDGSLVARVRRVLGVAPPAESPAGGLAGTVALAMVGLLGLTFFFAPAASQARAAIEDPDVTVGTVVTPDGKPVEGADAWLVTMAYPEEKSITLAKARTDNNGLFRLVVNEKGQATRNRGWRTIYAHKAGSRPAAIDQPDTLGEVGFPIGVPIRLTLAAAVPTTFIIRDETGQPIAGARVAIHFLSEIRAYLPDELIDRIAVQTGPDGRAVLNAVPLEQIRQVRVSSASLGNQTFHTHEGFKAGEILQVRNALPLVGRVVADDPTAARGLPVLLNTYGEDYRNLTKHLSSGFARAVTDSEGRFRVPALATGTLFAAVQVSEDSLYQALSIKDRPFNASSRIELEIPLIRMIHVRGLVQDAESKKPIDGVGVCFSSPELVGGVLKFVKTDANGWYEALAHPGSTSYCHLSEPNGYLKQGRGVETAIGKADGQVLPPFELVRGQTVRGIVVDERGTPVAAAKVTGKWDRIIGPGPKDSPGMMMGANYSASATSDAQGEFILEGIHKGANVMVEAGFEEARTERPQQAVVGAAEPVKLVINSANTVSLHGQVVDAQGKPVVGALVQIRSRLLTENSSPEASPIRFDSGEIRTDHEGRFRTPRSIKRGAGYRAEIKPIETNLMSENTSWLALKTGTRPFFPRIALRGLRVVQGRVVNSQGMPIAGALIRQAGDGPAPTETMTDNEGRFALPGVVAEPAFLFVAKNDFRFTSKPIDGSDAAKIDVTVKAVDEPLPRALASLPSPLSRADELAILHHVFDGYADRVIKQGQPQELDEICHILVWKDPARAVELLSDHRLQNRETFLRFLLAVRLIRENDQDARNLIEAIPDANMRSYAFSETSAALPKTALDRRLGLLNDSLISGRAVVDPNDHVLRLADIGGRLSDLGKVEQATNVFREAEAIAAKLPVAGTSAWARGRLAEELATVDLQAALNLLKGTEEYRDHDQYLGHIAHELAPTSPAESERVLMMMRDAWPHFRDDYTQRVCYRMVSADEPQALALASKMKKPRLRARALGAMALALSRREQDRPRAVRLLYQAFDVLDEAAASRSDQWDGLGMACTAGAGLLPIVEQVDARLVPEFLSRALALRPPIPGATGGEGVYDIATAIVATMVARYDRSASRQILDGFTGRAIRRRIGLDDWGSMFRGEELFAAAAVVDPARAAAMIDELPESAGLSTRELKNSARMAVARILCRTGDDRWRHVERNLVHLWPIDSEED